MLPSEVRDILETCKYRGRYNFLILFLTVTLLEKYFTQITLG
jgi:hypothetical protein